MDIIPTKINKIFYKKNVKFKDLQEFARENAYTVKRIKLRCFGWKRNFDSSFNFCTTVSDTLNEISFDIKRKCNI